MTVLDAAEMPAQALVPPRTPAGATRVAFRALLLRDAVVLRKTLKEFLPRTPLYIPATLTFDALGRTDLGTDFDFVGPAMSAHPLFGLGLNTFAVYYEFVTGRSNFGPHSYYIALLAETGIVGTALFFVYLGYLVDRLGALRRLGRALSEAGDRAAARVRPLAWGLTAALFGTMASNAFYLTMQMYYFFVFAMLIVAAPVVFARR